jgi:ribosomal protein L34E
MCFPFEWFKREIKRTRNFKRLHECSCNICGAVFKNMEQLITHMGNHKTDEINYLLRRNYGTVRCNKCFTEFRTVADMEEHQCVSIIRGLSPIRSIDSLESVLIHENS